ncbi:hypothetical protein TI03_05815, partial [Achromatium sp. WMS1]
LLTSLKFAFATSVLGVLLATTINIWQVAWYSIVQPILKQFRITLLTTKNVIEPVAIETATLTDVVQQMHALHTQLQIIREDLYTARRRFSKLDTQGHLLPDEAPHWVAVQDHTTQLIWEYKPLHDTQHSCKQVFIWRQGKNQKINDFIKQVNIMRLASFNDWHLPSIAELRTLLCYPGPDPRFFGPLTNPEQPIPILFSQEKVRINNADTQQEVEIGLAVTRESGLEVAACEAHVWLVRGGKI